VLFVALMGFAGAHEGGVDMETGNEAAPVPLVLRVCTAPASCKPGIWALSSLDEPLSSRACAVECVNRGILGGPRGWWTVILP